MAKRKRQFPPARFCPGCGAMYRAWKEDACADCLRDPGTENRQEGAVIARERRLARRQSEPDAKSDNGPVPYGEFPPGF